MKLKYIFFCTILFLSSQVVSGQALSFGVKGILYDYRHYVANPIVGYWYVEPGVHWGYGGGIFIYSRLDFDKIYIQSGLRYTTNQNGISAYNLEPERRFRGIRVRTQGAGDAFYRLEAPFSIGMKFLNRFRVYGGATLSYDIEYRTEEYLLKTFPNVPLQEIARSIARSYNPFFVSYSYGIGMDIGRFNIDLSYEKSMTSLTGPIYFEGEYYPFNWKIHRVMLSTGFRILPWKKGKE